MSNEIIEILPPEISPHIGVIRYTKLTNVRVFTKDFWLIVPRYPLISSSMVEGSAGLFHPDSAAQVWCWRKDKGNNLWALYDDQLTIGSVACWQRASRAVFYTNLDIFEYHALAELGQLPKPIDVCHIDLKGVV
jgi:hypothetical protein